MHVLEETYLISVFLLESVTRKIQNKVIKNPINIAYSDLNMSLYHITIIQARKMFEANIRAALDDKE